jgi:hypothetical protein
MHRNIEEVHGLLQKHEAWRVTQDFACAVGDQFIQFRAGDVETNPAILRELLNDTAAPLAPVGERAQKLRNPDAVARLERFNRLASGEAFDLGREQQSAFALRARALLDACSDIPRLLERGEIDAADTLLDHLERRLAAEVLPAFGADERQDRAYVEMATAAPAPRRDPFKIPEAPETPVMRRCRGLLLEARRRGFRVSITPLGALNFSAAFDPQLKAELTMHSAELGYLLTAEARANG